MGISPWPNMSTRSEQSLGVMSQKRHSSRLGGRSGTTSESSKLMNWRACILNSGVTASHGAGARTPYAYTTHTHPCAGPCTSGRPKVSRAINRLPTAGRPLLHGDCHQTRRFAVSIESRSTKLVEESSTGFGHFPPWCLQLDGFYDRGDGLFSLWTQLSRWGPDRYGQNTV